MNTIVEENVKIEDMIFEVRGRQVMLDSDLAYLYQCTNGTKSINLAVKRNQERFPEDFYFQLTEEEFKILKFQNETSSLYEHGGVRKLPFAFTEEGTAMLSSVLHTSVASKVSIHIMRAFVSMRKYISANLIEQKYINEIVLKDNQRINLLEKSFSKFEEKKKVNEIYFEGQIWDSYSKILDIFKSCKKELIIIDAYADKSTLDLIKNLDIQVTLIVKTKSLLSKIEIKKYQEQYHNLKVIYNDTFHDRYFILDKDTIYHCGTSLNYLGNKTFSINLLEDNIVKDLLIEKITEIKKNLIWHI